MKTIYNFKKQTLLFLLLLMSGFSWGQQSPLRDYYPLGQKIYQIGEITNSQSDYTMHGYTNSINDGCGNNPASNSFQNEKLHAILINKIFNTSYLNAPHDNNIGNVNWEVFNDHSCYSSESGCTNYSNCSHKGIDFKGPQGTNISSPFDEKGVVVSIRSISGSSTNKYVGVYYEKYDFTAFFVHVKNVSVVLGSLVNMGTSIAEIGSPNHLHLEIRDKKMLFAGSSVNATSAISNFSDARAAFMMTNSIKLSQSISIYGGSISVPKPMNFFFKSSETNYSLNSSQLFEIEIRQGSLRKSIPSNRVNILNEQIDNDNIVRRNISLNLINSDLTGFIEGINCLVTFRYNGGGASKLFFGTFFLADYQDPSATFADINDLNNWVESYVRKGASLGLFKGTSLQTFNPAGTLQKQHAAKIIVEAGVRLGLLNINTDTSINGSFTDVDTSSEFYKHIQTLRNYGYITAGTNFNPGNAITIGQICKLLVNVMQIGDTDIVSTNFYNLSQRKIVPVNTDATLIPYMTKVLRLVDIREDTPGFFFTENLWDFLDFSSVNNVITGQIQVDGNNIISRGIMAKLITNIAIWKAKKLNLTMFRNANNSLSSLNTDDYISYGEKYDNASITATSTPITPAQQTYSVASGGSINILYNPSTLPQHYYWSMQKNGATLTSNNSAHSSVTFTAPNVSVPTQWKLYTYTANNKGKARETYITINVGGSSGGSNASPTTQAHSLSIYGSTSSSLTASWTRGNGQNCIVTCKEVGANSQDVPDSGVVYTGNTNFASAPTIFNGSDTKVVYTGTGSSCNITGLNPNTQYQIAVFEYNGTTPSTVLYNLSNAPVRTTTTVGNSTNPPVANIFWDYSASLQIGQTYSFSNASYFANSFQWTITNGAIISNPTSSNTTNITFNNTGLHVLTLVATNTATGESNTQSYNVFVNNAADLLADLEPTNLNFSSQFTGGNPLNMSVQVKNNSSLSPMTSSNVVFVLSTDQIFDENDYFIGSQTYSVNPNQTITVNHIANNISNTLSGIFYIIAKVDYLTSQVNGNIDESNEQNNIIVKQINLQQTYVDFVAHSLTAPSLVNPHIGFSVSGTFQNIGNRHADMNPTTDFVVSLDQIFSSDDYSISGIITNYSPWGIQTANGPIVSGSTNLTIPSSVPNGNYFLIVRVNNCIGGGCGTSSNIPELINANNYKAIPIQVVHPYEPTIGASNYSITNITNNSLRLNWTRGNGQNCIVIGMDNNMQTVDAMTKDDISYTPNNNFVSAPVLNGFLLNYSTGIQNYNFAKILYDGNGNFVDIVGLQEGKTYTFSVVEYNNINGYKDYKQSNENIISIQAFIPQTNSNGFSKLVGNTTFTGFDSPISFFKDNLNGFYFNQNRGFNYTSDGGLSWKRFLNIKGSWATTKYIDSNFGYIGTSSGSLIKFDKINLNSTTIISNLTGHINSIYFNSNTGYVGTGSGILYKTTNGGINWSNSNFSQAVTSLYFSSNLVGWISLGDVNTNTPNIKVLKTIDGGVTWSTYILPFTTFGSFISDMKFFDNNNGIAITSRGWLLKTINGGSTWSEHNIFGSVVSETYEKFPKINFINNNVGYINFRNQKLAKTIDGGKTWQIFDVQNIANRWMGDIHLLSENEVILSGEGGILKTTTGGSANTIALNSIAQTSYCSNQVINLPYNITGIYSPANIFNIELSDANGNFATSNILQSFTSAGSGNINVAIPQNITVGTGYKLRIVGTSPNIVSNVTNTFAITTAPQATISITPATTTICPNTNLTFTATPTNGGASPTYTWKKNGVVVGSNSATYNATGLNNGDIVWAEMVSNQACGSTTPVIATPTTINVTQIDDLFIQAIDNILAASTDTGLQWIRNGQPITGATSQFYEAIQTGFYQFSVTVGGCTVLSDIYQLTTLGTDDNIFNSSTVSVYPNPTNDVLNIKSIDNTLTNLILIDLQGRKISEHKTNGTTYQIDLQNLPSAIYLLKIETDKGKQTVKVVKK